ncbi:MAG TPA: hypothetical protein VMT94_01880 [Burkholderiales bacterium]|nr:hypothetical protein [Burkholderiales bacterium]
MAAMILMTKCYDLTGSFNADSKEIFSALKGSSEKKFRRRADCNNITGSGGLQLKVGSIAVAPPAEHLRQFSVASG